MKRPPLWEAGAEAQQQQQISEAKYSAFHSSLQPAPLDRLHRIHRLRHYLNCWRAAGFVGPQPQPQDFDPNLQPLQAHEIYWRSEGRP